MRGHLNPREQGSSTRCQACNSLAGECLPRYGLKDTWLRQQGIYEVRFAGCLATMYRKGVLGFGDMHNGYKTFPTNSTFAGDKAPAEAATLSCS